MGLISASRTRRKDINKFHRLADTSSLIALDLKRHISAAKWQTQRSAFYSNLTTLREGKAKHERSLNEAESLNTLSQNELATWEDALIKLSKQIHTLESLRQELDAQSSTDPLSPVRGGGGSPVVDDMSRSQTTPREDSSLYSFPPPRINSITLGERRGPVINNNTESSTTSPQRLIQIQRRIFDDQDSHLRELSDVLGRQKHIGITMNDELDTQMGLLTELDTDVTRTDSHLRVAQKRLSNISKSARANSHWLLILGLVVILVLLLTL